MVLSIRKTQKRAVDADYVLEACQTAGVPYLAKTFVDLRVPREEIDRTMQQVSDVRDRCVAFSADDPKAGFELADGFLKAAIVDADWGGAVGALLVDAAAICSGEEIDHHPPAENASGFDPKAYYTGTQK